MLGRKDGVQSLFSMEPGRSTFCNMETERVYGCIAVKGAVSDDAVWKR